MSFSHKAFEFQWSSFETELMPLLQETLTSNDVSRLSLWIDQNLEGCRDPYEGNPLPANWRATLQTGDIQETADYALTRYYHPSDDCGIGEAWLQTEGQLPSEASQALLGYTIGEPITFDPGTMGSYFQDPGTTMRSLRVLEDLHLEELQEFLQLVRQAVANSNGLYVTF